MSCFIAEETMDVGEEGEGGQINLPGLVKFSSSGTDDDHNRDTEAGRGSKSPTPAHTK